MKKIVYCALGAGIIAASLIGCAGNDNHQSGVSTESETVTFTSESSTENAATQKETQTQEKDTDKENNKDVPEFLHNIADEVVADSEQFTIWESYSMHKSYETQGFGFCELIRDGVRSEALYTQSGIVIISEERSGNTPLCTVMYNGDSMTLEDEIFGVFGDKLNIYLYDFDQDGNDELVINSLGGDMGNKAAVIRMKPFERIPFDEILPEEFVSDVDITDVTAISSDEIEFGYRVEDWYGNTYEDSAKYTNYIESYDISENQNYSVTGWDGQLGMLAEGDSVTYSYMARMQSEDGNVNAYFALIKLEYKYDSSKNAFVCGSASMSIGDGKEDAVFSPKNE